MSSTNGINDTQPSKNRGSKRCERISSRSAISGESESEPNGLSPASAHLQGMASAGGLPEWVWFGG